MTKPLEHIRVRPSRNSLRIHHGFDADGRPAIEVMGPREYSLSRDEAFRLADAIVDAAETLGEENQR